MFLKSHQEKDFASLTISRINISVQRCRKYSFPNEQVMFQSGNQITSLILATGSHLTSTKRVYHVSSAKHGANDMRPIVKAESHLTLNSSSKERLESIHVRGLGVHVINTNNSTALFTYTHLVLQTTSLINSGSYGLIYVITT